MKKRICIYDFDGSLFNSPGREKGEELYFEATGKIWPYQGWWGRTETLLPPIIPDPIPEDLWIKRTVDAYKLDKQDKDTSTILMTGRPYKMHKHIANLLKSANIEFDRSFFRGMKGQRGSDTIEIKMNIIKSEILHDKLEILEIHEDRPEHASRFMNECRRWVKIGMLKKAIIHDVPLGKSHEF